MQSGQGPVSSLNCPAVLILQFWSIGNESSITLPCRGPLYFLPRVQQEPPTLDVSSQYFSVHWPLLLLLGQKSPLYLLAMEWSPISLPPPLSLIAVLNKVFLTALTSIRIDFPLSLLQSTTPSARAWYSWLVGLVAVLLSWYPGLEENGAIAFDHQSPLHPLLIVPAPLLGTGFRLGPFLGHKRVHVCWS